MAKTATERIFLSKETKKEIAVKAAHHGISLGMMVRRILVFWNENNPDAKNEPS